jgi:HEAT repeat protein
MKLAVHFVYQARPQCEGLLAPCRKLAVAGLKDSDASCRADAARLAAAPGIETLDQLESLLADTAPEVRRVALLALGSRADLLATDELLLLLHDPDGEVRALCEKALLGRGLRSEHIQLARSMTDTRPSVRAQVPAQLEYFPDLDARVWLERLSRDESPAVRAAVVRVAGEAGLQEWVRQAAGQDPCPTVRQIAGFYSAHAQANRQPQVP